MMESSSGIYAHNINTEHGFVSKVITAEFQADTLIARGYI